MFNIHLIIVIKAKLARSLVLWPLEYYWCLVYEYMELELFVDPTHLNWFWRLPRLLLVIQFHQIFSYLIAAIVLCIRYLWFVEWNICNWRFTCTIWNKIAVVCVGSQCCNKICNWLAFVLVFGQELVFSHKYISFRCQVCFYEWDQFLSLGKSGAGSAEMMLKYLAPIEFRNNAE